MLNIHHMFIFECGLCTFYVSLVRVVIYGHVYQLSVLTRKCLIAPFVEMGEYFQKSVLQYPEVFSFLQPVHRILHINLLWLLCCCVWSRLLAVPYCDYRKTHVAVALFSRSSKNSMLSLPSKKHFCDYCVTGKKCKQVVNTFYQPALSSTSLAGLSLNILFFILDSVMLFDRFETR